MLLKLLLVLGPLGGFISSLSAYMIIPIVINKKVKNVITVAKAKGDFTDLVAAMNSITDAGANKEYLVFLGPGSYVLTEPLVMKEYVHLAGSGVKETIIQGFLGGSTTSNSHMLKAVSHTTISSLEVINYGKDGTSYSIGVAIRDASSVNLKNVKIKAYNSNYSYGIYIYNSETTSIESSYITAKNGSSASRAVYNSNSLLNINQCEIVSDYNGVYTFGTGKTYIRYSKIDASISGDSLYSRGDNALNDVRFSEVNSCSDTYDINSDNKCFHTISTSGTDVSASCISDGLCH